MEGKTMPTAEQLNALITSLFNDYAAYLVDYAQNYRCSPEVAEDLVQETFIVALKKAETLYSAPSQRGWLIRTLRNLMANYQRRILYAQKLIQMLEKHTDDAQTDEISPSLLYKGLISESDLDILIRYWDHGDSIQKIADDYGISFDNCKKRLQRAKARFAKAYDEYIEHLN